MTCIGVEENRGVFIELKRLHQTVMQREDRRQVVRGSRDSDALGDLGVIGREFLIAERKRAQVAFVKGIATTRPRLGQTAGRERIQGRKSAGLQLEFVPGPEYVLLRRGERVILARVSGKHERLVARSQEVGGWI